MGSFGPNITILDDAWEAMATSPARAMLVSVKESHEDVEKSEPQIRQMATNILGANNLHQIGLNDLICRNETRVERVVQGRRYDHRMHCRRIDALHRYGRLVDQRMNGRREESDIQPGPSVHRDHRGEKTSRSGWMATRWCYGKHDIVSSEDGDGPTSSGWPAMMVWAKTGIGQSAQDGRPVAADGTRYKQPSEGLAPHLKRRKATKGQHVLFSCMSHNSA